MKEVKKVNKLATLIEEEHTLHAYRTNKIFEWISLEQKFVNQSCFETEKVSIEVQFDECEDLFFKLNY